MLEAVGCALLGLFVLITPGFLLSLALYPRKESLDFWKRVAVSFGLGVLLLIYVGFVLAQPGVMMLEAAPFIGLVLAVCVVLAFLARLRGGFEVVMIYKRAVADAFKKLKPPKPPQQPPAPPQPPTPQPEQATEKIPEEGPKEVPEQAPEKASETPDHPSEGG